MKAGEAVTAAKTAYDEAKADAAEIARLLGATSDQAVKASERAQKAADAHKRAMDHAMVANETDDPVIAEARQKGAEDEQKIAQDERGEVAELLREAKVAYAALQEQNRKDYIKRGGRASPWKPTSHYEAVKAKVGEVEAEVDQGHDGSGLGR